MNRFIRVLVPFLVLATVGCNMVIADDTCDHTEDRNASLDAAGATRLVVDAGAGSLMVEGDPQATTLEATGVACASRQSDLAGVRLTAERQGDTLYVTAGTPDIQWGNARLDLEIRMPASLEVEIEDGSGGTTVRKVASLDLTDGSGAIEVADVGGAVKISDGSGGITVTGVGRGLAIDDGSGGIEVAGVGGEVRISDGSGGITVSDVGGDVIVDEDGSGGISILRVAGSVLVREDGSGGIDVTDVQGSFTVERDGSGGIDHQGVVGQVSIPRD